MKKIEILLVGDSCSGKKSWIKNLLGIKITKRYIVNRELVAYEIFYNNVCYIITIIPSEYHLPDLDGDYPYNYILVFTVNNEDNVSIDIYNEPKKYKKWVKYTRNLGYYVDYVFVDKIISSVEKFYEKLIKMNYEEAIKYLKTHLVENKIVIPTSDTISYFCENTKYYKYEICPMYNYNIYKPLIFINELESIQVENFEALEH